MAKIVAIGHSTLDMFFALGEGHVVDRQFGFDDLCLPFPAKLSVKTRTVSLGGNAVNVGASLLGDGHEVVLISRVGEDPLGEIAYRLLTELGFNLAYTTREGETDTSAILFFQEDRTILSYHGQTPYRLPHDLLDVPWVYLSSLGFADYRSFHLQLMRYLSTHPRTELMYNPSEAELKGGFNSIKEVLLRAHTVFLNLEEAGVLVSSLPEGIGVENRVEKLMPILIAQGIKNIVITNGKAGAYFANEGHIFHHLPVIPVTVRDATGAGDAFAAGYMMAVMEGHSFDMWLKCGMAQAASNIEVIGATAGVKPLSKLIQMVNDLPSLIIDEIYVA